MAPRTSSRNATDAAQETVDRIRELNERIIENALEAGGTYLDVYERSLNMLLDYQKSLAGTTPVDWLQRTLDAQAAFARGVDDLYASTARETRKKE